MIPLWEFHRGLHLCPRLCNCAAQVAPADAEFDRNVTLVVLAIDVRRSRFQFDITKLLERHQRASGRRDGYGLDAVKVLPILRQESDHQREMTFAFKDLRHCLPADRSLHDRVYIAGSDSIPGSAFAVDFYQNIGLPQFSENASVLDALDRIELSFDLVCFFLQDLKVRTK